MRWILVPLLLLHALIHLLGLPLAWGGTVAGMPGRTLFPLGEAALRVSGVAWLVACLALLVAAGTALGRDRWRQVAVFATTLSQVLIVLWWPDARAGTLANILILAVVLWQPGWRCGARR